MADERTEKQKVKEITDKLEAGLKELFESEKYKTYYGGTLVYLYSSDMEKVLTQIKPLVDNSVFTMDRAFMEFCYIFDMIVVGILLVVSIILIAITFVVLRFTISFTLSEEFREIGVMKAIGIGNFRIRGLYLVKYMGLSVIGATIGFALSFPFGEMLMSVSSQSIIVGNQSPILINIFCTVLVIAVKSLIVILTIILAALITVLMERSFIAKEQGEIALMKAVGTRNGKIYAYHALRFLFVGMIAVFIGEMFAMPLTHLCIDPIFKMMGMELAVDYVINPVEMCLIFPIVILATTTISAFLTSLYTRKIKSSDTTNIE